MLKLLTLFVLGQAAAVPSLTVREQSSFWLGDADVRREVALTPAQSARIESAFKAYNDRMMALADKPAQADETIYREDRAFSASLVVGLTESQRRALFVREVRERGVAAFADDEVAKEVGLSGEELKRVRGVVQTMEDRDGDVSAELADDALKLPPAKTPARAAANDAKLLALAKAAEPREKARAVARKGEETDLIASLPTSVRAAWERLVGPIPPKPTNPGNLPAQP